MSLDVAEPCFNRFVNEVRASNVIAAHPETLERLTAEFFLAFRGVHFVPTLLLERNQICAGDVILTWRAS